nr:sirohydrochlorin cobaltochelatase [uncultured Draconibacterium sp.]
MKRFVIILFLVFSFLAMNVQGSFALHKAETKKGILLVTFGTSYPEAHVAFNNIENRVKSEFPEVEVRWAYTSKIIRKILKKRGEQIDSPAEALAKMGEDGFTHVAVQSLHIIPGEEYENLEKTLEAFYKMPKGIRDAKLGTPLLFTHADNKKLADFIDTEFKNKLDKNSALLLMGHGTHHSSNIYYPGFQYYLNEKSERYFLATVEGYPSLDNVIPKLKEEGIKKVVLTPFMSVAGDHAQNDMAGDEEGSWKSVLEKEGFEVEVILKGLAEYNKVVDVWGEHLKEKYEALGN